MTIVEIRLGKSACHEEINYLELEYGTVFAVVGDKTTVEISPPKIGLSRGGLALGAPLYRVFTTRASDSAYTSRTKIF